MSSSTPFAPSSANTGQHEDHTHAIAFLYSDKTTFLFVDCEYHTWLLGELLRHQSTSDSIDDVKIGVKQLGTEANPLIYDKPWLLEDRNVYRNTHHSFDDYIRTDSWWTGWIRCCDFHHGYPANQRRICRTSLALWKWMEEEKHKIGSPRSKSGHDRFPDYILQTLS
ncbi:hypothetical protein BU24DRAFT_408548 [Aaosphaeria arxii CBS 175.79]|uniref:Uncharacterized protein n=1 Tax=Aaosphaeria arxii CBS 175.79 TaxID=1450172 RepID=A0A6A5XQW7_9PLEO|nr:uncharacterized protein BU24DRAFT_408548 [Aaosphaeria arxii CBS 175.79]KAF2015323.1 hypothetical protein BU24DRAFT_408548 [Aaosphaeria arxii CBS 175.79]